MSRRVLMWVEDQPLRGAIRELLHGSGYRVESARSREDALARMAREGRGHLHRPGVVLVDADGDGRVVDSATRLLAGVPVLVLSSESMGGRLGDLELEKPFGAGKILAALAEAFGTREQGSLPVAHQPPS